MQTFAIAFLGVLIAAFSNRDLPVRAQPGAVNCQVSRDIMDTFPPMPAEFLVYAKSLIGTPYLYASTDPAQGFDCSGFITYVFNHFGIHVPRSSVDFTQYGTTIPEQDVKPGDLILFTGTDSTIRIVGHMGIIVEHKDSNISFIHSTSGKAHGVTITPLNTYYRGRLVKYIRVFAH